MLSRILIGFVVIAAPLLMSKDTSSDYSQQILAWQRHREAGLRSPTGWLTLAGLFWLKPGDNTIGSGETSDFLLPQHAPSQVGVFHVSGNEVSFTNLGGASVTVNQAPISGTVDLKHDVDDDKSDKIQAGPVVFYVIDRDGQLAVRVKDRSSQTLKNFKGTEFFPTNPSFRFEAKFIPESKMIPVPNVQGKTEMEESPGVVEFEHGGKVFRLRPIYEGKTLFFIFKDETSRKETYQGGRMVNTPLPQLGKVVLDFNKAYSPPCMFSPFATCPWPLKENSLPFRVEAGELRYEEDHR
jgi:uncharacterized protein (DUF1684 family)